VTKILFVDCDGTIREPINGKWIQPYEQIMAGADKAIAHYHELGYTIIGVSNQAGVAARHKSLEDCIAEQAYTLELLPDVQSIYFCPDFEGKDCWSILRKYPENPRPIHETWGGKWIGQYRKPNPGMLQAAAMNYGLHITELEDCWMVGDRPEDEQCAQNAGINFMWADIWRERWK
jgi:D-glycero-D-manno-heptose 1,7-bisphosphate phosphatase